MIQLQKTKVLSLRDDSDTDLDKWFFGIEDEVEEMLKNFNEAGECDCGAKVAKTTHAHWCRTKTSGGSSGTPESE